MDINLLNWALYKYLSNKNIIVLVVVPIQLYCKALLRAYNTFYAFKKTIKTPFKTLYY